MMTSFSIWQSFQSLVNTSQNSFFRPQTDFNTQLNNISKELFEEWAPKSEKNQKIRDYLTPFFVGKNVSIEKMNTFYGLMKYPKDYKHFISARVWTLDNECVPCPSYDCTGINNGLTKEQVTEEYYKKITERQIDLVDQIRWAACLSHKTKMPTLEKPKMTQTNIGWEVAPRDVSIAILSYYRAPVECTFKYTVVPGNPQTGAGDYIEYDTSSIPLEWPDTTINFFLYRLAQRYGLFIGNQFLAQFSEQLKQTL